MHRQAYIHRHYVDPGAYTIWTARSNADLVHAAEVNLRYL